MDMQTELNQVYHMDRVFLGTSRRLHRACARKVRTRRLPRFTHFFVEQTLFVLIIHWRHAAWRNHLKLRNSLLSSHELVNRNVRLSDLIIRTSRMLGFRA